MRCTVLASGSRGNCVYLDGGSGALLIDAGLSAKECLRRMQAAALDPGAIRAVLVTHEHQDHVRGLDVLVRHLDVPVYGTAKTLNEVNFHRRLTTKPLIRHSFHCPDRFGIGDFIIQPFETFHDAEEPCGFIIRDGDLTFGHCTDTGLVSDTMLDLFRRCDALLLESNHCPEMLRTGPYPEFLKKRIRSSRGHLSNRAAAKCLQALGKDMSQIILAHLSEVNNTPQLAIAGARDGFGLFFDDTKIVVASQDGTSASSPQDIRL